MTAPELASSPCQAPPGYWGEDAIPEATLPQAGKLVEEDSGIELLGLPARPRVAESPAKEQPVSGLPDPS